MPRDIYWSKQYETLPSFDKYKEPTQEELYSQLMSSNPGDMNYTPVNPDVKSPLPDLTAPKPEPQVPMASGYGPGQEVTRMPDTSRSLAGEPSKVSPELKDYLMSKYYMDPEGTFRQREAGRQSRLLGGIGNALNTFTKATTGFEADSTPYKEMALDADRYESQESKRQQSVRDYLKDKAEMALKGKNYDLQLQQLKSDNDYKRGMLGIKEKELSAADQKRMTPMGVAATDDDAKKAKDFAAAYEGYTRKLDELHRLRKEWDGELAGEVKGKMDSLAAEALIDYKNMNALGNLSGGDMDLVGKILGNTSSHMVLTSEQLAKLEQARSGADAKVQEFAKAYNLNPHKVLKPNPVADMEKAAQQRQKDIETLSKAIADIESRRR